ncbi:hypothetical protein G647_08430 [Cladophialophora carrionii CBS 160.54]|uniref:SP-RING-type domain-containing protein n=1 Tax=Cladophialophora carrionii CBS 160.54 TaxID=1279043 RepID=V9D0J4_9EURO|nr:uncharacterized protein G647_08430 [Cladophialophora carrionii CBS 160.54]ETI20395.1 hypothetical protein G647_08430 [Cladophialophora carrionii CBS 160.54]
MASTFEPQPLAAPLNDDALSHLRDLVPQPQLRTALERDRHVPTKRYLQSRDLLRKAAETLADITGDLNQGANKSKTRHLRLKARREKERAEAHAEDDGGEVAGAEAEAEARHEEFQRKAEELTKKMDMSIRGIIDDLNWLAEYPDILKAVTEKAQDSAEEQRRNFEGRDATSSRRKRRQQRISEDGDEDGETEDGDEEEEEEEPVRRSRRGQDPHTLDPSETPHVQLALALEEQGRRWTSQSLTDRYARDNYYKGWKGSLWDGQNPGENPPPMPHETLWFAVEEGRSATASFSSTQQGRQRGAHSGPGNGTESGEEEEDDLEISAENTRIRCPLTLLPYKEPMTSRTCNHSYEKTAILELLSNCHTQPKKVKCPDTGCNADINGEEDLYENQLLKRRVARILARQMQRNAPATSDIDEDDEDEDEDDDEVVKGTQRKPLGLGSSPVTPASGRRKARTTVKNENSLTSRAGGRESVIPDSQFDGRGDVPQHGSPRRQAPASRSLRGTQILDLEDDD